MNNQQVDSNISTKQYTCNRVYASCCDQSTSECKANMRILIDRNTLKNSMQQFRNTRQHNYYSHLSNIQPSSIYQQLGGSQTTNFNQTNWNNISEHSSEVTNPYNWHIHTQAHTSNQVKMREAKQQKKNRTRQAYIKINRAIKKFIKYIKHLYRTQIYPSADTHQWPEQGNHKGSRAKMRINGMQSKHIYNMLSVIMQPNKDLHIEQRYDESSEQEQELAVGITKQGRQQGVDQSQHNEQEQESIQDNQQMCMNGYEEIKQKIRQKMKQRMKQKIKQKLRDTLKIDGEEKNKQIMGTQSQQKILECVQISESSPVQQLQQIHPQIINVQTHNLQQMEMQGSIRQGQTTTNTQTADKQRRIQQIDVNRQEDTTNKDQRINIEQDTGQKFIWTVSSQRIDIHNSQLSSDGKYIRKEQRGRNKQKQRQRQRSREKKVKKEKDKRRVRQHKLDHNFKQIKENTQTNKQDSEQKQLLMNIKMAFMNMRIDKQKQKKKKKSEKDKQINTKSNININEEQNSAIKADQSMDRHQAIPDPICQFGHNKKVSHNSIVIMEDQYQRQINQYNQQMQHKKVYTECKRQVDECEIEQPIKQMIIDIDDQ